MAEEYGDLCSSDGFLGGRGSKYEEGPSTLEPREASLRLDGERPEGSEGVDWAVEELVRVWGELFWYG